MRYRWLLFDADGTLFDYDKAERTALQKTFEEVGLAFERRYLAVYKNINSQIWRDFEQGKISQQELRTRRFDLLFEAVGVDYDSRDFSPKYLRRLSQRTELIEGAEEVIEVLADKFEMALITNGLKDVQRPRIAASSLREYFKNIIISEEVGVAKPDTRIFDAAFVQMKRPSKDEVLIIGDSLSSDIQGGVNYGIDTCWFNPEGKANSHAVISTFEIKALNELLELLGVI